MRFIKIYFLLIFIMIITSSMAEIPKDRRIYRVLLQTLPKDINPITNQINIYNYLNLHLYHPLFERNDLGILQSAFFDMRQTKALSANFTQFQFCLKNNIYFSDGATITLEDLKLSLVEAHTQKTNLLSIKHIRIQNSCVLITLSNTDPCYFDKLTSLRTAILKSQKTQKDKSLQYRIGFGPYKIKKFSENLITLEGIPGQIFGSFTDIEFIKFNGDFSKIKHDVQDLNHLYHYPIPAEFQEDRQKVRRPLLKTYYILVRIPDRKLRILFNKCFNATAFVNALSLSLEPIPGLLPKGLPGWNVTNISDHKQMCSMQRKKKLIFYSYNEFLHDKINIYFNKPEIKNLLPAEVVVQKQSLDETIQASSSKLWILSLVGSDATEAKPEEFFNGFISSHERFSLEAIDGLVKNLKKAAEVSDTKESEKYYKVAHQILLESGYVIPLGQYITTQYYPKNIKNIKLIDRVNGFPRIDLMEIQQ